MMMNHTISRFDKLTFVLAGSFFILFFIPVTISGYGRVFHAWWDFTHVPAFFLISLGLLTLGRWLNFSQRQLFSVGLMAILLVPGVECIQGYIGREYAWNDILYGIIGCFIGCARFLTRSGNTSFLQKVTRPIAAILVVGALAYPICLTAEDRRVSHKFPVLSAFDSPLEVTRWNIHGCDVAQKQGWEITIRDDAKYPSIVLTDMARDWSSMSGLGVDVFLHGNEPMEMTVVVDDLPFFPRYDDRFQQMVMLNPGPNTVQFNRQLLGFTTAGRPMKLSEIFGLGIYFNRKDAGRRVNLTKVFLFPDESRTGGMP